MGNLAGQAFDNATGDQHGLNLKSLAKDTVVGGALGFVLHYAGPFLQKVFCFDGDTPVQVAPQAAQAALLTTATTANHGRGKTKPVASLGLPAPTPAFASSTRKIKDMKKGDVVVSRNARTGKVEYKRVLGVSRSIASSLLAVSIADKRTGKIVEVVKATPEHPFFTTKGLVSAANLGIGTELVTRAGPSGHNAQTLVVKAVKPVASAVGKDGKRAGFVVYNLEVEGDHTYFVGQAGGGAWVHNACRQQHHLLPQEFRDFFRRAGLNIDNYVVKLGDDLHQNVIHGQPLDGRGGSWNTWWRSFISNNPGATQEEILQYMNDLMKAYGIDNKKISTYWSNK